MLPLMITAIENDDDRQLAAELYTRYRAVMLRRAGSILKEDDRAEEAVQSCREQYDVATSRAVARLNILLELTAPYVRPGGRVIALKGSAAREELAECARALQRAGVSRVDVWVAARAP